MIGITKSSKSCIKWLGLALIILPFAVAFWIWFSPLSFVPVPWPDDSAFYFVAKDLFKWPPRWVMLPQAPFEPTYRIWNFNTMPLYPILIGLGRLIGIDGIFAIKIFPLGAWAASAALLGWTIFRSGLPFLAALLISMTFMMDPTLRWASVIVRPESLIGLCGIALVLGLTLGFPEKLKATRFWDPIAALLVVGAYAHFNAVHLMFPVLLAFRRGDPAKNLKKLTHIGFLGVLYLSPWLLTVALKFPLFLHQMTTQWTRLSYKNGWLSSTQAALGSLFQDLGSPEPWPAALRWAALIVAGLILLSLFWGLVAPIIDWAQKRSRLRKFDPDEIDLVPAAGWLLGSIWLWDSKPEVWFTTYLHLSLWTFLALALLKLYRAQARSALTLLVIPISICLGVFTYVNASQAQRFSETHTWKWPVYYDFIDCIDRQLVEYSSKIGNPSQFRVWAPTFPDITIELSLRHPQWEFTRTNDFSERTTLALQHGHDVEAVVVPEMINWPERVISAPAPSSSDEKALTSSVWMNWNGYFLNKLWIEKGWKPNRYICQRGRWQAFIFLK